MPRDQRQWFVNGEGQTFVIVDAQQPFWMGSQASERGRDTLIEGRHLRQIDRCFAIAATPITTKQFVRFLQERPKVKDAMPAEATASADSTPQTFVTWFQAAEYCNWLSEKEGIARDERCFVPNALGNFAEGMRAKDNCLKLSGYRLPTEAEWEFACRAGTTTRFYFGESELLLGDYAQYHENSEGRRWPVASRKPNDFGLFDMHGNVWQWCEWPSQKYPDAGGAPIGDSASSEPVVYGKPSALRGGSYTNLPDHLRSACRLRQNPDTGQVSIGFRPVRTYRP